MAIRNVVRQGDDILRKKCREVTEIGDRIKELMDDMLETMRAENGVGIAGPQVGVMRRLFVAEPEPDRVYYMINPEIYDQEGTQVGDEGCLSVPGLIGTVERPEKIKIRATGLDGELHKKESGGSEAGVLAQKNNHFNGFLYGKKPYDIRDPAAPEEETDNTGESV